jgi:hypothetical protein
MNDTPVLPEVKEEPKRTESKANVPAKRPVARRKDAKKPIAKTAVTKAQPKVRRSPTTKAPARKVNPKQRKPFPYARVLAMWKAGKSSMAIAKSVGRYDSKAADPMHSFRVTLTRFHKGVRIDGKLVKLPHRVSKAALKRATKAGKKAAA